MDQAQAGPREGCSVLVEFVEQPGDGGVAGSAEDPHPPAKRNAVEPPRGGRPGAGQVQGQRAVGVQATEFVECDAESRA